jgi:replicative DNA helicase
MFWYDGSTPRRDSGTEIRFPLAVEDFERIADAIQEQARVRRQVEQAQAAVVVRTDLDELDEELESFVTDTGAAPAAMPSVQDGLVLSRDAKDIEPCLISALPYGEILADYVWLKEEHFNYVCRWIIARGAAIKSRLPHQFFQDAVLDTYHFDRALRAADSHGMGQKPMRYDQLKLTITRSGTEYALRRQEFQWSLDVPPRVTDAVSAFVIETPPDALWVGVYLEKIRYTHYDPIIYAEFGVSQPGKPAAWQVEVARWD